jgi:Tfp pilus assembly protein PilF
VGQYTQSPSSLFYNPLINHSNLILFSLIILIPTLSSSSNLKSIKEKKATLSSAQYSAEINSLAESNWNSSQNLLQFSVLAFQNSDLELGNKILDRVFQIDGRSYYANYFMAFTLEAVGKRTDAIKFREALLVLDPWGTDGQIELIKDYLAAGNKESAQKIGALINRNYPGSQADIDALALLVG